MRKLLLAGVALLALCGAASAGGIEHRPTFDCANNVKTPLAFTICMGGEEAAWADWNLNAASWAYYAGKDADEWDKWGEALSARCHLSRLTVSKDGVACVVKAFNSRAEWLRSKLTGDAFIESQLAPQQHVDIQRALIELGFLQNRVRSYGAGPDGQFGPNTRIAIKQYQASIGAAPTGFLSQEQIKNLTPIVSSEGADAPVDRDGNSLTNSWDLLKRSGGGTRYCGISVDNAPVSCSWAALVEWGNGKRSSVQFNSVKGTEDVVTFWGGAEQHTDTGFTLPIEHVSVGGDTHEANGSCVFIEGEHSVSCHAKMINTQMVIASVHETPATKSRPTPPVVARGSEYRRVSCKSAPTAGVERASMTSGWRSTSSFANACTRATCPDAQR